MYYLQFFISFGVIVPQQWRTLNRSPADWASTLHIKPILNTLYAKYMITWYKFLHSIPPFHSSNFVKVHPIRVPMFHNFVSARLCLGKTLSPKTCLCYDLKVNINLHLKYSSRCKNDKSRRDNIIDHGLPRLAPLKPTKKTKNIVLAHAHKRNFRRDRATRTVCRICSVSRRHTHQNQAPVVQKSVDKIVAELKNVHVICSKSGKLSSQLVAVYLDSVLKPYVKEDFVLILDSWGGQSDKTLSEQLNTFGYNYEIRIIPPGCTPYAQPCDVYFFRQVKNFIKKLQNSTSVLADDRQLNTRSDAI